MKRLYTCISIILTLFVCSASDIQAGNPDRQGEAGAPELLLNPWARSAGLHTINTSCIGGVESMRLNPAGIVRFEGKTQFNASHMIYLQGTGTTMSAIGIAQKMGKNGAFGITAAVMRFGDIPLTTTQNPEGTGTYFSPSFFHLGLAYSHQFDNKVSVGLLFRGISESIESTSAFGFAFDAGVQYVAGDKDNFKIGVSLRNIGGRMVYKGESLAVRFDKNTSQSPYQVAGYYQAQDFELPSVLNLGLSYDFYLGLNRLTAIGNFTSNAFSRDQLGAGVEFEFMKVFSLRAAYKYELGSGKVDAALRNVETGFSGGLSVEIPLHKKNSTDDTSLGLDYAYRTTNPFGGTHNFGIRLTL